MKTEEIVNVLRSCPRYGVDCAKGNCAFFKPNGTFSDCIKKKNDAAADRLEELVDRCARYAEEIAVLREKLRRVPVAERLPKKDGKYMCWYGFNPNRNALFCQVLDYYATDPMPHFQHEGLNGMTVTHWMEIPGVEAG